MGFLWEDRCQRLCLCEIMLLVAVIAPRLHPQETTARAPREVNKGDVHRSRLSSSIGSTQRSENEGYAQTAPRSACRKSAQRSEERRLAEVSAQLWYRHRPEKRRLWICRGCTQKRLPRGCPVKGRAEGCSCRRGAHSTASLTSI